jgi:hypothetical protein
MAVEASLPENMAHGVEFDRSEPDAGNHRAAFGVDGESRDGAGRRDADAGGVENVARRIQLGHEDVIATRVRARCSERRRTE